jgi:hypothetical protein
MTKTNNSKITFTPLEWEIIKDRPEDCITEVLYDQHHDKWERDQIDWKVNQIYDLKSGDEIDLNDELTFAIIEDCIEGTFMDRVASHINLYGYSEHMTQGQWGALVRAANSIEKKTGVKFSYALKETSERGWSDAPRIW